MEDWLTDFIHRRPRVLRHLEGEKRARFLAQHLDQSPREVLTQHRRSLCLVQPRQVWAHFVLDTYSSRYQARLGFALADDTCSLWTTGPRGLPVTDLKWRALGRSWLDERGGDLELDHDTLVRRLNARAIYLALGLSRNWRGAYWLLVVGVHVVPDYTAAVEIECAQ